MTEQVGLARPSRPTPLSMPMSTLPSRGGSLGLPQATSLVLGTIIGVGIFNVPASLARYGPISLVALALTTVGAVCLALLFASLTRRMPADGGPYAYARAAFGNLVGFSNAWLYWIPTWAGNAAIATGWVLYVERFVNTGPRPRAATIVLTLAGIWAADGDQPARHPQHGADPAVDLGPQVPAAARDVDDRALLHRPRQLHAVQPQRAVGPAGDRQRDGAVPVLVHRRRVGVGGGRQGERPDAQRAAGHDPGHPRVGERLPAVARRGLRHPAQRRAAARRPHRSPPPPRRSAVPPGWVRSWPSSWSCPVSVRSTAGPCWPRRCRSRHPRTACSPSGSSGSRRRGVPAFGIVVSATLVDDLRPAVARRGRPVSRSSTPWC